MRQSSNHRRIQQALDRRKKWLIENEPVCIFCLHGFRPGDDVHLVHKIRRSEKSDIHDDFALQTMDLNTGLGHFDCHEAYDNDPEIAVTLPGFCQVMLDVRKIDKQIFNKEISNIYFRYLATESLLWMYYNLEKDNPICETRLHKNENYESIQGAD